jgi:hypothetical protein
VPSRRVPKRCPTNPLAYGLHLQLGVGPGTGCLGGRFASVYRAVEITRDRAMDPPLAKRCWGDLRSAVSRTKSQQEAHITVPEVTALDHDLPIRCGQFVVCTGRILGSGQRLSIDVV